MFHQDVKTFVSYVDYFLSVRSGCCRRVLSSPVWFVFPVMRAYVRWCTQTSSGSGVVGRPPRIRLLVGHVVVGVHVRGNDLQEGAVLPWAR